MTLPAGVGKDAFAKALREFISAVGGAGVEQAQQIVRIANTYKIPLYPISTRAILVAELDALVAYLTRNNH